MYQTLELIKAFKGYTKSNIDRLVAVQCRVGFY